MSSGIGRAVHEIQLLAAEQASARGTRDRIDQFQAHARKTAILIPIAVRKVKPD
jgi:hypothetical protein